MSYESDQSFVSGIWTAIGVLFIICLVFILGRGCQQIVDNQDVELCGRTIQCYETVILGDSR